MKKYFLKSTAGVAYFFIILALVIVTQPLASAQQESLWKPTKPMMLEAESKRESKPPATMLNDPVM